MSLEVCWRIGGTVVVGSAFLTWALRNATPFVLFPRLASDPMHQMSRSEGLAFLAEGTRTGKLATVRPDGHPHVVPVWFVVEDEDIVFNTWHTSVKSRNLAADTRAALVVDYEHPPYGYVVVEGEVELSNDLEEVRRIATIIGGRYMGEDKADEFGARNGVEGELAVRLHIDRLTGRDDITG